MGFYELYTLTAKGKYWLKMQPKGYAPTSCARGSNSTNISNGD